MAKGYGCFTYTLSFLGKKEQCDERESHALMSILQLILLKVYYDSPLTALTSFNGFDSEAAYTEFNSAKTSSIHELIRAYQAT